MTLTLFSLSFRLLLVVLALLKAGDSIVWGSLGPDLAAWSKAGEEPVEVYASPFWELKSIN
jgi:hypothetical protein